MGESRRKQCDCSPIIRVTARGNSLFSKPVGFIGALGGYPETSAPPWRRWSVILRGSPAGSDKGTGWRKAALDLRQIFLEARPLAFREASP